jgi:predicted CXXCH cytochrome family protein
MKLRNATLTVFTLGLAALAGQSLLRSDPSGPGIEADPERGGGRGAPPPPHRVAGYAPTVATGLVDHAGKPVGVSCMTCHATREPDRTHGLDGVVPDEFHPRLKFAHANQSCLSCHNPADYDRLRAADGRAVVFSDAQQLCAQCHGPQTRDYRAGSHGGMNGYWDQSKGPRSRNTCTDCHDPHAPAYPQWTPVFPPIDTGARQQAARAAQRAEKTEDSTHE